MDESLNWLFQTHIEIRVEHSTHLILEATLIVFVNCLLCLLYYDVKSNTKPKVLKSKSQSTTAAKGLPRKYQMIECYEDEIVKDLEKIDYFPNLSLNPQQHYIETSTLSLTSLWRNIVEQRCSKDTIKKQIESTRQSMFLKLFDRASSDLQFCTPKSLLNLIEKCSEDENIQHPALLHVLEMEVALENLLRDQIYERKIMIPDCIECLEDI